MDLDQQLREYIREEARAEIASLCGLILRRLQEHDGFVTLRSIFGEALADFSGHTGEGEEPGATKDESDGD